MYPVKHRKGGYKSIAYDQQVLDNIILTKQKKLYSNISSKKASEMTAICGELPEDFYDQYDFNLKPKNQKSF